jgi:hypothetical protein
MSAIRYTPPAGGSGVIPDLQQVLDTGNSAIAQTITLIDNAGTDDCVWTPRGMTAVSGGLERLEILAASTTTTPDEEGVIRMYGAASFEEQITLETRTSDGGSITVSVDQFTKLRIFNNRIEYHKLQSLLPSVATLLFPATITNGDIYQIQPTPGTFAWLSDLPTHTSGNMFINPVSSFIATERKYRQYGKVITIELEGTSGASIAYICQCPFPPAVEIVTYCLIGTTSIIGGKAIIDAFGFIYLLTTANLAIIAGSTVKFYFTYQIP